MSTLRKLVGEKSTASGMGMTNRSKDFTFFSSSLINLFLDGIELKRCWIKNDILVIFHPLSGTRKENLIYFLPKSDSFSHSGVFIFVRICDAMRQPYHRATGFTKLHK